MSDNILTVLLILSMIPITIFLKKFFESLEDKEENEAREDKRPKI